MRVVIVYVLLSFLCAGASAQAPSPQPGGFPETRPPALPLYSGTNVPLSSKEAKGVRIGEAWANNRSGPARGDEGTTVFLFGSTLPTIVCAPLYVCDLALQEGEAVNDLNAGDSVRWKITPATQGAGETLITHVIIKPVDIGLVTNLVITTNRRTYIVKLVSRERDWMPRAAFQYPDDVNTQWQAYRSAIADKQAQPAAAASPVSPPHFDFGYDVSGDAPWKPIRVYTDGTKTYILFPSQVSSGELPALVEIGEDNSFLGQIGLGSLINGETTRLVNYRFVEHRFEVDKVLTNARLSAGVGGGATTVTIARTKAD